MKRWKERRKCAFCARFFETEVDEFRKMIENMQGKWEICPKCEVKLLNEKTLKRRKK